MKTKVKNTDESKLMKHSNVNFAMARDLKSNAADVSHHAKDFVAGMDNLGERLTQQKDQIKEDDLRSLRSEYDYASKKKFVDVLPSTTNHLSQAHLQSKAD